MSAAERLGAPQIRFSDLSAFIKPPKGGVMGIVKGYFDDSQTVGKVWAVGGYVGSPLHWDAFEEKWDAALKKHDVPYCHMRETGELSGPFAKWLPSQEHPQEWASFLGDLAKVIDDAYLTTVCSLVRLEDLARFNAERGMSLEPYSLAAYGCMLQAGQYYTGHPTELIFDHVEKVESKLAKAREYAESDKLHRPDGVFDNVALLGLPSGDSYRNISAIQAADFWIWEYRKNHLRMDEWWASEDRPKDWGDDQWEHMERWVEAKYGSFEAATRKSAQALMSRPNMYCQIWNYQELCDAHETRGGVWT